MRVAIFGDTGGHYRALRDGLAELGVQDWQFPDDVQVVHLGDLVHRGGNSDAVVSLVDNMMESNEGRWKQIIGNHEAMHLNIGVTPFFRCNCSEETIATLQRWYSDGLLVPAAAILGIGSRKWTAGNRPVDQEEIVTELLCVHGGITREFWEQDLGAPETAIEAMIEILSLDNKTLTREGVMTAGFNGRSPGPIWATAADETFVSWSGFDMPFSQVVGHTTPYSHLNQQWWTWTPKEARANGKGVPAERRSVLFGQNGLILCQDPGYGARDEAGPQPYLLIDAEFVG